MFERVGGKKGSPLCPLMGIIQKSDFWGAGEKGERGISATNRRKRRIPGGGRGKNVFQKKGPINVCRPPKKRGGGGGKDIFQEKKGGILS